MRAFRNRRTLFHPAAILFGVLYGVTAGLGPAWGVEPIPLAPVSPTKATNNTAETQDTTEDAAEGASGDPTAVDIAPLAKVHPNSLGLLDTEAGGFGVALWKDTDGALIERLMPRLPAAFRSPTMRSLQRRLLLSTATAPSNGALQTNLLPLRIERLAAMGETKAIVELVRIVPARAVTESIALAQVESLFLSGARDAACGDVRKRVRDYHGADWQRLLIFCEALAGESDAVQLGLSLLQEMEGKSKPVFFSLIDAVLGREETQIPALPDPSPLEMVMIKAAKRPLPQDAGTTRQPALLRAIAEYEQAPMALRLEAGERAEAMGTFAPDALAALYRQAELGSEAIGDTANAETQGAMGRALLLRAAAAQTDPESKARLLKRLWDEAWAGDPTGALYGTTVRVTLPELLEITPSLSLAWFAPAVGKALLLGEKPEAALAWLALLEGAGAEAADAKKARDALWPFVRLADEGDALGWDPARLEAWWKIEGATAGKAKAALLFGLLAAMGEPVGAGEWAQVLDDAPQTTKIVPSTAIWNALGEASAQTRRGETVLLALLSLGEGGPAQAAAMTLEGVLAALRRIGLFEEARRLAIEAALTQGL